MVARALSVRQAKVRSEETADFEKLDSGKVLDEVAKMADGVQKQVDCVRETTACLKSSAAD